MILLTVEAVLWTVWFVTGEKLQRVWSIARKVHMKRRDSLIDYAYDMDLEEEYDGYGGFLNFVQRRKIRDTFCIIMVIVLIIVAGYFEDPSLY